MSVLSFVASWQSDGGKKAVNASKERVNETAPGDDPGAVSFGGELFLLLKP